MVAAGSLVAPNTTVPTGEIWAGNPAKKLRDLDAEEAEFIMQSAVSYSALARIHAAENAKTPEEIQVLSSALVGRLHATLQAVACPVPCCWKRYVCSAAFGMHWSSQPALPSMLAEEICLQCHFWYALVKPACTAFNVGRKRQVCNAFLICIGQVNI